MLKGRGKGLRAQVTVFIILGLVLVVAFSFALFARSLLTAGKLQQEAQNILTDSLETNSITFYVESCLEQVSTEAFVTLGQQGGKLRMRDGLAGVDFYVLHETGKEAKPINYGIKPNTFCDIVAKEIPDYPRRNTEINRFEEIYRSGACQYVTTSGFLGEMGFDQLCSITGANTKANSGGDRFLACENRFLSSTEFNTQTLLEQYISKVLPDCTDFDFYEELFGHNITIPETEQLQTTVTYGLDSSTIDATFPFIVKVGKRSVKTFHNFTYVSPIPYREIYTYAADLMTNEARNNTFNLTRDYKKPKPYRPSYNVTFIENPCLELWSEDCEDEMMYDDIFIIKDENTVVEGKKYEFIFALKDRKPVLDYIHTTEADANFDIKIKENETLYIRPEGFDPDDKNVSYFYTGWKEDYDEEMDMDCCEQANLYGPDPCYKADCLIRDPVSPRNWTTSNLFVRTKQEASVNLTREDMGLHYLQVYVYEDSELYDYQNVSILVFDLPTAVPNVSNGFDDIPNNYASKEDPYTLDASSSIASMVMGSLDNSAFDWKIIRNYSDGTSKDYGRLNTEEKNITLPYDIVSEYEGYTERFIFYQANQDGALLDAPLAEGIGDITFGLFNETGTIDIHGVYSGPVPFTLELRTSSDAGASPIYSEPAQLEVEVYQCLPHRDGVWPSGTPFNGDMYPYNSSHNSFEYNHTCCGGDDTLGTYYGQIIQPDNIYYSPACYEEDYYGLLIYLLPRSTENPMGVPIFGTQSNYGPNQAIITDDVEYILNGYPTDLETIENSILGDLQSSLFNNLYRLDVRRYCGGNRGNVCGGRIELEYTALPTGNCIDIDTHHPSEDERCAGPNAVFLSRYRQYRYWSSPSSHAVNCGTYGVIPRADPTQNPSTTYTLERYISNFYWADDPLYGVFTNEDTNADGICNNEPRCVPTELTNNPSSDRIYYYDDGVPAPYLDENTPLLCQGGCDRTSGTCNAPINCACSRDTCGAECEFGDLSFWQADNNTCHYGCLEDTCRFMQEHFCPNDPCILLVGSQRPNNDSGTPNCQDLTNYVPRQYTVYFGGEDACEDDACTWNPAIEGRMQTLDEGYCYDCDEDGCDINNRIRCEQRLEGNTCYYAEHEIDNLVPPPYCNRNQCNGIVSAPRPNCWDANAFSCTQTGWQGTCPPTINCYRCNGGTRQELLNLEMHSCPATYSEFDPVTCP